MNLSSSTFRWIVIASLVLIVGVAIILITVNGDGGSPSRIVVGGESDLLPSFGVQGRRSPTTSVDPCTLLNQSDIEGEMGKTLPAMESGFVDNPLGERYCRIVDPDHSDQYLFYYSIVFDESIDTPLRNDGFNVDQLFKGRQVSPNLIQPLDELGDEAFWGGTGVEVWNGLHILVHDVYLQVDILMGDEQQEYEAARNIAVAAMERLFGP